MSNVISDTKAMELYNEAESKGIDSNQLFKEHGVDKVEIHVTEEVYSKLGEIKQSNENIADVVNRIIKDTNKIAS